MQWAMLKLKQGHEISGALELRKAFVLLAENENAFPDFIPNRKSYGFLQMVFGLVPQQYAALLGILGLEGNTKGGLQRIKSVCASSNPVSPEANIMYCMAQVYILHQPEGLVSMRNLARANPDNLLISFFLADMLLHDSQSGAALQVLNARPKTADYLPLYFMNKQYGDIFLYKGSYPDAVRFYRYFQAHYKGQSHQKDAWYKLFVCYYLSGNSTEANACFTSIGKYGSARTEPDRYAQRFFEDGNSKPEPLLLRARLLSDGGRYMEAEALTGKVPESYFTKLPERIEFQYRKARIADKLNQTEKAVAGYRSTIALSPLTGYYFAPNAALQLAYIYRTRSDTAKALEYLHAALTYKQYPYRNGIESKVKAALHELGE